MNMYKNYFFLSRFVEEANHELKGYELTSAFSQEKDKLILSFQGSEGEKFIEASVNHGFPYITLRRKYSRAKRNTVSFFEEVLPVNVNYFAIKMYDRVVKIDCGDCSFFFLIRGKYTNFILLKNNAITYFKKEDVDNDEGLLNELNHSDYTESFSYPDYSFESTEALKKKYAFTGKEILLELKGRNEESPEGLVKLLEEIRTSRPAVFYYKDLKEYEILFECFSHRPDFELNAFDTTGEAFYYFISRKFSLDELTEKKNRIAKFLNKQLEKLSQRLNKLDSVITSVSKEEFYNQTGNVLLINIHRLRAGMDKIILHNVYNDKEEEIKLDPSMHPRNNVDSYFEKARNEKVKRQKAKELKHKLDKEYFRYRDLIAKLDSMNSKEEITAVMKELKIKETENSSGSDEPKMNYKQYVIEGKYNLYVGKDSRNNDELTTRFAKQNDYWFHARGLPGSHVVLRNDNAKEPIPKNIIKKAAAIAAYHSKGKTAGLMPVSYTQKKYVVKKKGMEAGKVALMKEDVVLVKPEIPSGCEYVEK